MLFEAFFWDPNKTKPDFQEFFQHPEFRKLLSDWGRVGDKAVIVEENSKRVGAAWYRLWTKEKHSYGFVDPETPEIGMGVTFDYRSKGIGRKLLRTLIEAARNDGFKTISLSVSPSNFARQLYESQGFEKVGGSGTSWILMLKL
jgi:ribosomal protein S18 acetylase RimI-like enzyme